MKATAIGLLILSVYWIEQGIAAIRRQETSTGIELLVMAVVLLPVAKYVWSKNLGPRTR